MSAVPAAGGPARTTRLRLPDGLSAVEAHPPAGASPRRPVLLLHGMMGGSWQFSWLQPVLARAGYRSLAIDYRGHHDSAPVERLGRVGVMDYVRDALAGCAHLGGGPIVVGQSMGGLIAQLLAERGAVRAAVLMCSLPPRGVPWRGVGRVRGSVRHLPAVVAGRPLVPDRAELDDLIFNRVPEARRHEFFARQVPESSRAAAQIALGLVGVDPAAVTCPVLSVSAGDDRLVLASVGRALARRYGGEHRHLVGAGHYAIVGEPGWEEAAASVIHWMDRLPHVTPPPSPARRT